MTNHIHTQNILNTNLNNNKELNSDLDSTYKDLIASTVPKKEFGDNSSNTAKDSGNERFKELLDKIFSETSTPDTFNTFDYLRTQFTKSNFTDKKETLDRNTKKLAEILKDKIKLTTGEYNEDKPIPELLTDMETKSNKAQQGLVAFVSQMLARNYINNPDQINLLTNPDNDITIYITENNKEKDIAGVYFPPEQTKSTKHAIVLDNITFMNDSIQEPDPEDKSNSEANVLLHEWGHFMDRMDGKVDGLRVGWDAQKQNEWREIANKMVIKNFNEHGSFPKNFQYMLKANKEELLAAAFELFDIDPISLKSKAPEAYAFIAKDRGYDPASAMQNSGLA